MLKMRCETLTSKGSICHETRGPVAGNYADTRGRVALKRNREVAVPSSAEYEPFQSRAQLVPVPVYSAVHRYALDGGIGHTER